MDKTENSLLVLSVADLFYSDGDVWRLWLQKAFDLGGIQVNRQVVPLTQVVQTAEAQQPSLILVGHRPIMESEPLERWRAAGCPPWNWDIVKALKSNPNTEQIPVLMMVHEIVPEDWACGVNDCLAMPVGFQQFLDSALRLIGLEKRVIDS